MVMRTQKIKLTDLQVKELGEYKESKDCSKAEMNRIQAILMVNEGARRDLVKSITGLNQKYAFDLRKEYLEGSLAAIRDARRKKPRALLTENQRKEIIYNINHRTPRDFGFHEDYWTTWIVATLIKEQYGVQYKSRTSLYILFKESNFSYHKPDKQYKDRNQKDIEEWVVKNTPIIQEHLNDPNTIVLAEDELFLSTRTTTQKIWLRRGDFPKIDCSSKRHLRAIYGFLNASSGAEHAFKALKADSEETCKILDQIGEIYKGYKIVIIWDSASYHKSAIIREYLRNTKYSFHMIPFPRYAPELNPQENVWKSARAEITHNTFIENIDKSADQFVDFLNNSIFDYKLLDRSAPKV